MQFLSFWLLFEPTNNRIMVGLRHFCIHFASVGFPVVGAENVVDAHIDAALMIGETRTVSAGDIAVGKSVADLPVGVGKRTVVEVAADNDTHTLVAVVFDIGCHSISLRSTFLQGFCQFVEDVLRFMFG